jgi:hypothetical protein
MGNDGEKRGHLKKFKKCLFIVLAIIGLYDSPRKGETRVDSFFKMNYLF